MLQSLSDSIKKAEHEIVQATNFISESGLEIAAEIDDRSRKFGESATEALRKIERNKIDLEAKILHAKNLAEDAGEELIAGIEMAYGDLRETLKSVKETFTRH